MNMQAFVDGMSQLWQRERAETQMTLGGLIAALEAMPPGTEIANLHGLHSYRGYYCDLALRLGRGMRPAADLLVECRNAMGQVFQGYKGGDYVMGALTPLWVAEWGDCGDKLLAVRAGGEVETTPDE